MKRKTTCILAPKASRLTTTGETMTTKHTPATPLPEIARSIVVKPNTYYVRGPKDLTNLCERLASDRKRLIEALRSADEMLEAAGRGAADFRALLHELGEDA